MAEIINPVELDKEVKALGDYLNNRELSIADKKLLLREYVDFLQYITIGRLINKSEVI